MAAVNPDPELTRRFVRHPGLAVSRTARFAVIGVVPGSAVPVAAKVAVGGSSMLSASHGAGGGGGAAAEPVADDRAFELLTSVGEECVTNENLRKLLAKKPAFRLYDGFEPSGRMHIAQGIFKACNVNKCTQAGGTFVFWVADWFALMNDKMGGDLDKIRDVGEYFVHVWTAAGMDMSKVEFHWASKDITTKADKYWPLMLDIARRFTVNRIKKCCTIMGRAENKLTAAQILYPLMQCTDVFFLRADICQLGVDQRKVNMLALEYCDAAGIKLKPVILSHHMIYGLKAGQAKMSKSDSESAIFMEDSREDIERKIGNAYCPLTPEDDAPAEEGDVAVDDLRLVEDKLKNPCLDYLQHIVLSMPGSTFDAAGRTFTSFDEVKAAFLAEDLSVPDLKAGLIDALEALVAPVRTHFETDDEARALLERITQYKKEDQQRHQAFEEQGHGDADPTQLSGDEPALVHVVFAPLPQPRMTLGSVLTTLRALRASPPDAQVVLWMSDWSALVNGCCGGDAKVIHAAWVLFLQALQSIDTLCPAGSRAFTVQWQGEAILTKPSEYWISVINAGRHLELHRILDATGAPEQVGPVVAAMMHIADTLELVPSTVACEPSRVPLQHLAGAYMEERMEHLARAHMQKCGSRLRVAEVVEVVAVSTQLKEHPSGNPDDEYFINDDPKAGANKKMKRAFCEPGNVDSNPPLRLARDVAIGLFGQLEVDGVVYTGQEGVAAMEAHFKEDKLTPQLLKPALTEVMARLLDAIGAGNKTDKQCKQAENTVKNFIKAASKKKK